MSIELKPRNGASGVKVRGDRNIWYNGKLYGWASLSSQGRRGASYYFYGNGTGVIKEEVQHPFRNGQTYKQPVTATKETLEIVAQRIIEKGLLPDPDVLEAQKIERAAARKADDEKQNIHYFKEQAAEQMYEALVALEEYMTSCGYFAGTDHANNLARQARSALAKARG